MFLTGETPQSAASLRADGQHLEALSWSLLQEGSAAYIRAYNGCHPLVYLVRPLACTLCLFGACRQVAQGNFFCQVSSGCDQSCSGKHITWSA